MLVLGHLMGQHHDDTWSTKDSGNINITVRVGNEHQKGDHRGGQTGMKTGTTSSASYLFVLGLMFRNEEEDRESVFGGILRIDPS